MIPHAGIIHAFGWIIIKKIQVAITQEVSTIRNNLIFANNGLGTLVFIFIVMLSLLLCNIVILYGKRFCRYILLRDRQLNYSNMKALLGKRKTPIEGYSFAIGVFSL